jgi:hypothetical protein
MVIKKSKFKIKNAKVKNACPEILGSKCKELRLKRYECIVFLGFLTGCMMTIFLINKPHHPKLRRG